MRAVIPADQVTALMLLDKKDAKILSLIQLNNRLTSEQIGDEIGLSHTAVVRRLKRLRENAVIVADVAVISAEAAGLPVRVNLSCSIEREQPDTYDRFREALRSHPHVVSADCVLGKADFTFTVVARSMEAFAEFLQALSEAFPSIKNVTSLAVLRQIKRGLVIPVEPTGPDQSLKR